MKVSVYFKASELKKELIRFGVSVLRCSQKNDYALVTIESCDKNIKMFESFCKENNFAGPLGTLRSFSSEGLRYIDYGSIFKYKTISK